MALFLEQVGEPMGFADCGINEAEAGAADEEEVIVDLLVVRKEGVGDPGTIKGKFGSMSARSVGVAIFPMVPISHVVHWLQDELELVKLVLVAVVEVNDCF